MNVPSTVVTVRDLTAVRFPLYHRDGLPSHSDGEVTSIPSDDPDGVLGTKTDTAPQHTDAQ